MIVFRLNENRKSLLELARAPLHFAAKKIKPVAGLVG
jgi:hypothetical protein